MAARLTLPEITHQPLGHQPKNLSSPSATSDYGAAAQVYRGGSIIGRSLGRGISDSFAAAADLTKKDTVNGVRGGEGGGGEKHGSRMGKILWLFCRHWGRKQETDCMRFHMDFFTCPCMTGTFAGYLLHCGGG